MSNASGLTPENNHALVELGDLYKNIQVQEGKYDSRTNGVVVGVSGDSEHEWAKVIVGRRAYWSQFREGTRIEDEGKLYAFVALDDIEGTANV